MKYYVYWLYDETCTNYALHGYVGISNRPYVRMLEHKLTKRFPDQIQMKILHEADASTCKKIERNLRPLENIGWNKAVGGGLPPRRTLPLSEATKLKISVANKGSKRTLESREKMRQAQLGKKHTPEQTEKIRQKLIGTKRDCTDKCLEAWRKSCKFTPEQVTIIQNDDRNNRILAEVYGTSRQTIIKIKHSRGIYGIF